MRKAIFVSALVGVVGLAVFSALAQPKKDDKPAAPAAPAKAPAKPSEAMKDAAKDAMKDAMKDGKKDAKDAMPGMDPKAMEAMMAAMMPNENHKALEAMVGDWETTTKFWMAPGTPATEGTGTMKSQMILGGRILHTTSKGSFAGMEFEGAGTTGYNNVTKQFEATWSDNMGTATMFSVGTADAARKVFTITGTYDDPTQGKVTMRQVTTIVDKDHYTMEFFSKGSDGKEFKAGEIHATRKGTAKAEPAAPAKTAEPAKKETPAPAKK